jgi:plastin-1
MDVDECDLEGLKEKDEQKRAEIILNNSEKLGCERYIEAGDIAKGKEEENILFTAQLYNSNAGIFIIIINIKNE